MHQTQSILHAIGKKSHLQSSPFYQPNTSDQELREQLASLRNIVIKQDSQIIRLENKISELNSTLFFYQTSSKINEQHSSPELPSQIPTFLQNKELRQSIALLQEQNVELNGKNNDLEADMRQLKSDYQRLQTKVKELQILEKMRQQRFKDEVQRLTPVIVQDTSNSTHLKQGISYVTIFLRSQAVACLFELFVQSSRECEGQKKTSYFTVFLNLWRQLKANFNSSLRGLLSSYKNLAKVLKLCEENYGDIEEEAYKDTLNEWVVQSLVEIRLSAQGKQKEQKLFRYLGLYYRSKFPIKGERFSMDQDVKTYFEDAIIQEANRLLEL